MSYATAEKIQNITQYTVQLQQRTGAHRAPFPMSKNTVATQIPPDSSR